MKGLYKKISAGVLALALVLGGSLSQGAMAYAHSDQERCQYELSGPSGNSVFPEFDEMVDDNNYEVLKENENKDLYYRYEIVGKYNGRLNGINRYYDDIYSFFDCMLSHLNMEGKRPKGDLAVMIGRSSYLLYFP